MVLLSAHGLPPAMIAELLDCHPATVRRWISRSTMKAWPGWPTGRGPGGQRWAAAG
jgi:Homeodomain-like domain